MNANGNSATPAHTVASRRGGEQGYVLLVFIFMAAFLLVGIAAILRTATFEGRREREDELIFRGMQYRHAVQLYFRKFGRYPVSLDDLEKTNGLRFLRKQYKDPMTKEGKWRPIHIGPGGVFTDALTAITPPAALIQPSGGGNPSPQGTASGITTGGTTGGASGITSPQGSQPGGTPPSGFGLSPMSPPGGNPANNPALSPSANPGANNPRLQPGATIGGPANTPGALPGGLPQPSSSTPSGSPPLTIASGAIAGFASMSTADSIKVWNDQTEYNKWEFLYDYRQDPVAAAKLSGGAQPQPASQPPQQPNPQPQPRGPSNPQAPPIPSSPFPGFQPPSTSR